VSQKGMRLRITKRNISVNTVQCRLNAYERFDLIGRLNHLAQMELIGRLNQRREIELIDSWGGVTRGPTAPVEAVPEPSDGRVLVEEIAAKGSD
jgi:hypothetical protein